MGLFPAFSSLAASEQRNQDDGVSMQPSYPAGVAVCVPLPCWTSFSFLISVPSYHESAGSFLLWNRSTLEFTWSCP